MKLNKVSENQRKFRKLLIWLGGNKEPAAQKYESIRKSIIKILNARGCYEAEELADETIDRVTQKIDFLVQTYVGDPRVYFFGVAKNVFLEHTRKPLSVKLLPSMVQENKNDSQLEHRSQCLDKCLKTLSCDDSELILKYYKYSKTEKIEHRKRLAESLGISNKTLRVRVFRIRKQLQTCFKNKSY